MTPVTPGTPVSPDGSDTPRADGSASHDGRGAESRLPSLALVRGMAWSALVALWLLCGCGGDLAFTGGSIPPGGTRLVGRIDAAEYPLGGLKGATIQVTSSLAGYTPVTIMRTSANDGTFVIGSVPTGPTSSSITVTVTPASSDGRQSQTIAFQATNGVACDLVVSLPLNTFSVNAPNELLLEPVDPVQAGGSATIHALLLNQSVSPSGVPIVTRVPAEPTLLYTGNFGSIGPADTFVASPLPINGNFTGTLTAFWPSLASTSTQVTEMYTAPGSGAPTQGTPDPPPPLESSSTTSVRAEH